MISIIICTLQDVLPYELVSNIQSTIGVDYEIISIYNENNKYSIFEAYNVGVSKAKYPFCCFMHDDIIYKSNNWGYIVEDYFQHNEKLGVVAVAGCQYFRKAPSFWSIPEYNIINVIQSDKTKKKQSEYWLNNINDEQIVIFDGLWFCTRTSIFNIVRFDENNFKGFHFYDLDLSLQIITSNYSIISSSKILIEHTSRGNIDIEWINSSITFYNKWKKKLPVSLVDIDTKYADELENRGIISFLRLLYQFKSYNSLLKWFSISCQVKNNFFSFAKVVIKYIFFKKYI